MEKPNIPFRKFQHQVEPEDDALHALEPGVAMWSESGMFTAHDPGSGISVYMKFAVLETKVWEAIFAIFLPSGELLVSRSFARRRDGEPMSTGQATLTPEEPREAWRMQYDGAARRVLMSELAAAPLTDGRVEIVGVNLLGEATSPAFGTRPTAARGDGASYGSLLGDSDEDGAAAKDATPSAGSGSGLHIEQSMRVTGELLLAGKIVRFEGTGHRDHSCGPRNRTGMWRDAWINGSFPSGRTFHALQVFVIGRPIYFMGYLWDGLELHDISNYVAPLVDGPMGQPWRYQASFEAQGNRHVLQGELLGILPSTIPDPQGTYIGVAAGGRPLVTQGPTRWSWDGETGYGWAERIFTPGGWLATTGNT